MEKKDDIIKGARSSAIVFFLFFIQCCAFTQSQNKNYPVQFSQFIFSYPLVNPSSIGVENDYEVIMGYQQPVSGFRGLSTYFCNISFIPYRISETDGNRNIIGLRFFNDHEGAYINRTRFYATYAFHTHITDWLSFSGGIDLGGMNFSIKSTPSTEGASVFKADASAGIWLYNEDFHIGLSVNQLFRSVFQPLDEKTILPTHFNITGSYAVISSDDVVLRPHILITLPYYNTTSFRACLYGLFFSKIISVVGWHHKNSISAMLGINDLTIYNSKLDITLSYSTNVHKASLNINKMEISINYSF